MSASRQRRERGLGMVEVIVVIACAACIAYVATSLIGTSRIVVDQSRAAVRAASENRRGLEAIANVLRSATVDSLDGFTAGVSESPSFARAVDAVEDEPEIGEVETIAWRASTTPWNGDGVIGELWLQRTSGDEMLANRVPQGGFTVRKTGRLLEVDLTTAYVTEGGSEAQIASRTSVAVRN